MQRLFEYAVVFHPKARDKKEESNGNSVLVIPPKTLLAKDEKVAALSAARSIPDKYASKLDQVEILVRPF